MKAKAGIYGIAKKAVALLFSALFFALFFLMPLSTVEAADYDENNIKSRYAAVYNIENGMFVFEKNSDEHIAPAGLAKIMTAIIALDTYKDLDRKIKVPYDALAGLDGAVILGLLAGEEISVKDLIYTMLVGGCNDSAAVIAYDISGNSASFAAKMNDMAVTLGLSDTVFKNPTGLDAAGAYTTVHDASLLCAYAMKKDGFSEIVNTTKYTVEKTEKHDARTVYTRNYFLSKQTQSIYYWQDADGISSSFTDSFGYMLISSLSEYSLTYICVCTGSTRDENGRIYVYGDVKNLLQWAVKEYTTIKVLDESQIFGEIKVTLSNDADHVCVVPKSNVYAFLPRDINISEEIEYRYEIYKKEIEAPVERGITVGKLIVYRHGKELASVELVTKSSAERSGFLAFKSSLFGKKTFVILGILVIVFIIFGIIRYFAFLSKSKGKTSE